MRNRYIIAAIAGGIMFLAVVCAGLFVGAIALTDRVSDNLATQVANNSEPEKEREPRSTPMPTATQIFALQAEPTLMPTVTPAFTPIPLATPNATATQIAQQVVLQATFVANQEQQNVFVTPMPVATAIPQGNMQSFANGLISVGGFPRETHPVRWVWGGAGTNLHCFHLRLLYCRRSWVISYDHRTEENINNPSAVWSGGANVDNLIEQEYGTYLLPESGYIKSTLPEARVTGGGFQIDMHAAPNTNYTVVARGLYTGEGDRHIPLRFYSPNHPGRVKVMRYPVPPDAGGFFGEAHLVEDIVHGHGTEFPEIHADNCGDGGCVHSYVIFIDYNDGSLTIYHQLNNSPFELVYTNAIQPS